MGSLTNTASLNIMRALFPASTTGLTPITGGSATAGSLRIYNTTSADTVGIYSRVTSNVIHQMTLIAGSTSATGNPAPSPGLSDANVLANTLVNGGAQAGTLEFCTNGKYPALSGSNGGNVAMNSGAGNWNGWTLSTVSNKGQAVNDGPITFPTFNGGTAIHIWGWCVTANAQAAGNPGTGVPTSITQMVTGSPGIPTILAYGDLSYARTISQGDTPSFTSGAVVITLD